VGLGHSAGALIFADRTMVGVQLLDAGVTRWQRRSWLRLGAGVARSSMQDTGDGPPPRGGWVKWGEGLSASAGRYIGGARLDVDLQARLILLRVPGLVTSTLVLLIGAGFG
jgi:hypothetical protein